MAEVKKANAAKKPEEEQKDILVAKSPFGPLSKKNVIELVVFTIVGLILFVILPLIGYHSGNENLMANIQVIGLLLIGTVYMGVVGWMANDFKTNQVFIPFIYLVLYEVVEVIENGMINTGLGFNFLETSLLFYFLNFFMSKRRKQLERKANKPFPKGINNRKD